MPLNDGSVLSLALRIFFATLPSVSQVTTWNMPTEVEAALEALESECHATDSSVRSTVLLEHGQTQKVSECSLESGLCVHSAADVGVTAGNFNN